MIKILTFVAAVVIVMYVMGGALSSDTLQNAVGVSGTHDAQQLQAGAWTAFLIGIPVLWLLSQFVNWWD